MVVINCKEPIYFDVDDTLVMWGMSHAEDAILITCPANTMVRDGETYDVEEWSEVLLPNKKHISALIKHKNEGHTIIVWSQGGSLWAETIIKALKLEEYVNLCIEKPTVYYDDLNVTAWLEPHKRKYIK